jgi:hypothetical protein
MHGIRPHNDFEKLGMVGIINGTDENPIIKVIQIKDETICTNEQIIDFINSKVESIQLNNEYYVRVFKNTCDFTIWQRDGKLLDVVEI